MSLSNNTIERMCRIFGFLAISAEEGLEFVSSAKLAEAAGTTEYTVRKDIGFLNAAGYTRKGYEVDRLKKELEVKLNLNKKRKACIAGLGRLGTALLDYQAFQEDGFEIVAGFDISINKLERIRTNIEVYTNLEMKDIIKQKNIELGIITVPAENAQAIAENMVDAGIKGILNFSPVTINVPEEIVHVNMDFTNALRFVAAKI